MEHNCVDECPPGLESIGETSSQQAENTQYNWNQVEGVIPVIYNDACVVQISIKTWHFDQISVHNLLL